MAMGVPLMKTPRSFPRHQLAPLPPWNRQASRCCKALLSESCFIMDIGFSGPQHNRCSTKSPSFWIPERSIVGARVLENVYFKHWPIQWISVQRWKQRPRNANTSGFCVLNSPMPPTNESFQYTSSVSFRTFNPPKKVQRYFPWISNETHVKPSQPPKIHQHLQQTNQGPTYQRPQPPKNLHPKIAANHIFTKWKCSNHWTTNNTKSCEHPSGLLSHQKHPWEKTHYSTHTAANHPIKG